MRRFGLLGIGLVALAASLTPLAGAEAKTPAFTALRPDGLTPLKETVTVNVEIEPILTTSTYIRIPETRGLRAGYEAVADPEQVRVVLFGPLPVLDTLSENDVRVTLDLFALEPGTHSIEPEVDVPDRGIEVRSVQPTAVTVTISPTVTNTLALAGTGILPISDSPPVEASQVALPLISPAFCHLISTGALPANLKEICLRIQEPQ